MVPSRTAGRGRGVRYGGHDWLLKPPYGPPLAGGRPQRAAPLRLGPYLPLTGVRAGGEAQTAHGGGDVSRLKLEPRVVAVEGGRDGR